MAEAKKDGTSYLLKLKNPIPKDRADLRAWDGLIFVGRHPGLADDGFDLGWNFAAPVGQGGFPDDWFVGFQEIEHLQPVTSELLEAAKALVLKLDQINDDPAFVGVFQMASIHGAPYSGPSWVAELDALRTTIKSTEPL